MNCALVLATAVLILVLSACGREPEHREASRPTAHEATANAGVAVFDSNLPIQEVEHKLQGNDVEQVADAIVQMVTMEGRPEVVGLLQSAWDGAADRYPQLNWPLLRSPLARVALAQVLGQWHREDPQYRAFILNELAKTEGVDKRDVLIALGAVATDEDIAYLERTSREEEDEVVASAALAALQVAGGESARQALERIKNDPKVSLMRKQLATQLLGLPMSPRD
jgi:hypothetical protein